MRVASIISGVVGGVVLLTSLLTVMFFPLDSFMLLGKVAVGLALVTSSLILNWENVKEGVNKKNTAFLITSIFMTVGMATVLGGINYLAQAHKKEVDLTKDKVFTLSDQTQKVLKELPEAVTVTAFYRKDEAEGDALRDLVGRYKSFTDRLKLELINPEIHPDKVAQYKVTEQSSRIIIESRGQESRIKEISEEALTNAIIQVGTKEKKKFYFTQGHGEPNLTGETPDALRDTIKDLRSEGYDTDTVNLVEKQAVPADTAVLMVVGPHNAFFAPEVALIEDHLRKGGKMVLMVEPGVVTGLENLLRNYNLELGNNTIMDATQFGRLLGQGPDAAIVLEYAEHPAVKAMEGQATVFKSARSVTRTKALDTAVTTTELAFSNQRSWGETRVEAGDWQWNDGEMRGPVPLMAVSTRSTKEVEGKKSDETRLLVIGDAEVAGNQFRVLASNRDLLLNVVAYVVEEENKISIRPKQRGASRIQLTPGQASMIAFFALDGMPVSLLSLGLAVWLVRRRR